MEILPYCEARDRIEHGCLLLWRPTSLVGRVITTCTRQPYSHAALAGWVGETLLAWEFVQWRGGRAVNLSRQVRRWPGACDVYRVRGIDEGAAVECMARRTGEPYGWLDFLHLGFHRATRNVCRIVRAGYIVPFDRPVVCSGAVVDSVRRACDWEILPGKAVWNVTPGDLAGIGEYLFTLGV